MKRICPECVQGKHINCTGEILLEDSDELVPCACSNDMCSVIY